jgi:hypothetical protein
MRDRIWICRDGRQLRVAQMDEQHIINCINKIRRHWPRWRAGYLSRLEIELTVRQIKRGA